MLNRLPETIDPLRLVDKRQELKGLIALVKMKRLASLLVDTSGNAQLDIRFERDSAGLAIATGTVTALLRLRCQRCLEPMDKRVDSRFTLGVVASLQEARNLPDNYEPLIADQGKLSLAELAEDEILLAMPDIAMHSDRCSAGNGLSRQAKTAVHPIDQARDSDLTYNASSADQPIAEEHSKPHPFAALAALKEKLSK